MAAFRRALVAFRARQPAEVQAEAAAQLARVDAMFADTHTHARGIHGRMHDGVLLPDRRKAPRPEAAR